MKDMTFTIENPGDTNLILSGTPIVEITGTDADQFSVLTQPTSPVTPLGSTTFQIRFQPGTLGAKTANISIVNDDTDENPFTLTLAGDAASVATFGLTVQKNSAGTGTVTSSPAGIDCGAVCSESYDVNTAVSLTASTDTGSVFAGWSGGGCSGTGSCVVTMDQAYTVTATFNEAPEINIKLGDTSLPSGSAVDFGASQSDMTFVIENLGAGDLVLSGTPVITITGTNADQFSVLAQPDTPVAASGSTTFAVRFLPTGTGALTANISIASNDVQENPFTLTLAGNVPSEDSDGGSNAIEDDGSDSGGCFFDTLFGN